MLQPWGYMHGLLGAWFHSLAQCNYNYLISNLVWQALSSNSSHCFPEDFLPQTFLLGSLAGAMKRNTRNKQNPPHGISIRRQNCKCTKLIKSFWLGIYVIYIRPCSAETMLTCHHFLCPTAFKSMCQRTLCLCVFTGVSEWLSEYKIGPHIFSLL